MGKKSENCQIVYRGEALPRFIDGGWVLFQRPKHCGGGYWLGKTYPFYFMIELERPVSLNEGLRYIIMSDGVANVSHIFDDDFKLT